MKTKVQFNMKYFNIFQPTEKKAKAATTYQYMIEFMLPEELSQEFIERMPRQRKVVNRYFRRGTLISYALSLESSKMWAIFKVSSELELMELLADMPLTPLVNLDISCLTIFNMPTTTNPEFSLS